MHITRSKLSLHSLLSVQGDVHAEALPVSDENSYGVAALECDAGVPFFNKEKLKITQLCLTVSLVYDFRGLFRLDSNETIRLDCSELVFKSNAVVTTA